MHDFFCQGHTPRVLVQRETSLIVSSPLRSIFHASKTWRLETEAWQMRDWATKRTTTLGGTSSSSTYMSHETTSLLRAETSIATLGRRPSMCDMRTSAIDSSSIRRTGSPWAVGGDGLQRGCLREIGFKHTCRPGKGWCQGDTDGRGTVQMNGESLLVSVGASWRCRLHRGGQCLQHL